MPVAQKTLSSTVGSLTTSQPVHLRTSVFDSELAGVFTMGNLSQGRSQKSQEEKDSVNELSLDTTTSATGADREVMFHYSSFSLAWEQEWLEEMLCLGSIMVALQEIWSHWHWSPVGPVAQLGQELYGERWRRPGISFSITMDMGEQKLP
ncbi:hypothetical protein WISP_23300 [Willisornis vidua]|uniref:Uncharacterized protein n=1 Tax=Willisornis vidua TaxID=1566151 RepID=A0ABQ9DRZ3_9PASS|nr:hypothetical protein WISP_23300 [Willisornis vidua]